MKKFIGLAIPCSITALFGLIACTATAHAQTITFPAESERITITGPGSVDLEDLVSSLPSGVLTEVSSGIYYLEAHIMVEEGATLNIKGPSAGGDVSELRMRSDYEGYVFIRADSGATVNVNRTTIKGWDKFDPTNSNIDRTLKDGRAYLQARSRLNRDDFASPDNATLNITNSTLIGLGTDFPTQRAINYVSLAPQDGTVAKGNITGSTFDNCVILATEWENSGATYSGLTYRNSIVTDYDSNVSAQSSVYNSSTKVNNTYDAPEAQPRWSSGSQRIYIEGHGRTTFTEIMSFLNSLSSFNGVNAEDMPLEEVSAGVWMLRADLFIEDGCQLLVHGSRPSPDANPTNHSNVPSAPSPVGGDCNELRLKSDSTGAVFITVGEAVPAEVISDWGFLDIRNTKVTSWDEGNSRPDTAFYSEFPTLKRDDLNSNEHRAFIKSRSGLNWDFRTSRESRIDIIDSEIAYLGLQSAEAYGLSWKVGEPKDDRAYTNPNGVSFDTTPFVKGDETIYDKVDIWGDIKRSRIHHNRFAVYTFGHKDGMWEHNETDNNEYYGFDPHDDSDDIIMRYNHSHHNKGHGMICSKRCNHNYFGYNISNDNGDLVNNDPEDPESTSAHGIMVHREGNYSMVEHNHCYDNTNSGISLFASDYLIVRDNLTERSGNGGIRISVGTSHTEVYNNTVRDSANNGIVSFRGSDSANAGTDGLIRDCLIYNNTIEGAGAEMLKLQDCYDTKVYNNVLNVVHDSSLPQTVRFGNCVNVLFKNNDTPASAEFKLDDESTAVIDGILSNGLTSVIFSEVDPMTIKFNGSSSFTFNPGTTSFQNSFRTFKVTPSSSEVIAAPQDWPGGPIRSWVTVSEATNQFLTMEIGDLTAGQTYNFYKNGSLISSGLSPNSAGVLTLGQSAGSTSEILWELRDPNYVAPPNSSAITGLGSFIESSGIVSMEAANYHAVHPGTSNRQWIPASSSPSGSSGATMFMPSGSPSKYDVPADDIIADSPYIEWEVDVSQTGNYDIRVRGQASTASPASGNDSCFVAIEYPNGSMSSPVKYQGFPGGSWNWQHEEFNFGSSGTYKVRVYMREDELYVDKVIMSRTSLNYNDSNSSTGISQSPQNAIAPVDEDFCASIALNGSTVVVSFETENDNATYRVQQSTNMTSWSNVGSAQTGNGSTKSVNVGSANGNRFYRVSRSN